MSGWTAYADHNGTCGHHHDTPETAAECSKRMQGRTAVTGAPPVAWQVVYGDGDRLYTDATRTRGVPHPDGPTHGYARDRGWY